LHEEGPLHKRNKMTEKQYLHLQFTLFV